MNNIEIIMNNIEFVEKVKEIQKQDTVFAYGTYGSIVDEKLISWVRQTQLSRYHDKDELIQKLQNHIGKRAYECTALVTVPLGIEGCPTTTEIYNASPKRYLIEEMPEIVGLGVYLYGHVGIYIGNGKVIESTFAKDNFGVAITNLADKPWTTAFEIAGINYEEEKR